MIRDNRVSCKQEREDARGTEPTHMTFRPRRISVEVFLTTESFIRRTITFGFGDDQAIYATTSHPSVTGTGQKHIFKSNDITEFLMSIGMPTTLTMTDEVWSFLFSGDFEQGRISLRLDVYQSYAELAYDISEGGSTHD